MASFIHKLFLKLIPPLKGIIFAIRNDFSFQFQLYVGLVVLLIFMYIVRPLSQTELLFLLLSYTLVLITELQNSAFESALDRLHPERHDHIGRSKDMAAGAVMIAGFFALGVVFVIVATRVI